MESQIERSVKSTLLPRDSFKRGKDSTRRVRPPDLAVGNVPVAELRNHIPCGGEPMRTKTLFALTLMLGGAPAASAAPTLTSTKALDSFAHCFVRTQEQASKRWSFVPTLDGGTFSNLAGQESDSTYFLRLRERNRILAVALESNSPEMGAEIMRAAQACA
jgi:hypothetical protein